MWIEVLGSVGARRADTPIDLGPPGQRAVLGLLALAGGQPLPRAELIDTLWGARPPSTATNIIQTYVKHLRRLLEPDRRPYAPSTVLPSVGDGYALRLPADDIDLQRFRRLVGAATDAQWRGEPRRAATLLREALALWRGEPLVDIPVLASHPKVTALVNERQAARARYGDLMIATGAAAEALAGIEEAAGEQPLDEAAQARLIRAYQAIGRRGKAFAVYRDARRRLVDELGVEPGRELQAAYAQLLDDGTVDDPGRVAVDAGRAGDRDAAAAGGGRPAPTQLPADVYAFTGRSEELTTLDGLLAAASPPEASERNPMTILVLAGTAGVGKTALAVHWAQRVRGRFPDGQLYVDLRGYDPEQPTPPGDVLTRFLTALGVADQDIPLDIETRASRYRTELTGRRMLILLDNAASVDQVRPLLPGTASCVVIVTSRDSLAGLVVRHGARRLDLDLLPLTEAVNLLGVLVGDRVRRDPRAAADLAVQCARLPLALRVATELAATRPATPLSELVRELVDQQRRLEALDAGGDSRTAVRAVFSWSYRHLPPPAARAFRLLGLHPGPDIDAQAAAALIGVPATTARGLLDLLTRAHLVQPARVDHHGMHDLLRAYAAALAHADDPAADRGGALTRLFDHYLSMVLAATAMLYPAERPGRPEPTPPFGEPTGARAWLDAERTNLLAVCTFTAAHGWHGHTVRLAGALFRYLDGGHYTDALTIHRCALQAAQRAGDRAAQADAMTNLGSVYWRLGRYTAAAEHHRRALIVFGEVGDRLGEAHALTSLGSVYWRLGRNEAAAHHHEQALGLFHDLGDHAGEARALTNLGNVYRKVGRNEAAADHHERALMIFREIGHRLGEAHALTNLGNAYCLLGRFEAAAGHHERALVIFREIGHRLGEAHALTSLGDTCCLLGRFEAAAGHHERALVIFREIGERYGEAAALNGLGEALRAAGRLADARERHSAALSVTTDSGDLDEHARASDGLRAVANHVA